MSPKEEASLQANIQLRFHVSLGHTSHHLGMSGRSATYIAFGAIVKRSLTTFTTSTRYTPRPLSFLPPHQTLVSKATKSRKIPKNHFTSHRPLLSESQQTHHESSKNKEKRPKRKAAQRSKTASTSLHRVAVEAQRSRAVGGLIRGHGKTRHVDPEVETKDVTAYCAAETYNVHVARDLLSKEGWIADPKNTGLFPQVLHVQVREPEYGRGWEKEDNEGLGDVFVFPSGSVVTWNVSEKTGHHLVEKVLIPAAGMSHPDKLEAEDLEYIQDPTRETSEIIGDTIILGTKALSDEPEPANTPANQPPEQRPETDTILAKIAFSSALARSTKLAVLESTLTTYLHTTRIIPDSLSSGKNPSVNRAFILRKTGELLHIRAQLNLYSELTDSLPDIFWDSPHELGLENYYDSVGRSLDVGQRIKALNEKMDYASEIARVLRERLSERHGHWLEWIIIWLICIEVVYGSWHLFWEGVEHRDPNSTTNLLRRWVERELAKEDGR
jgi:required for meiotic nuclear division protein 1